MNTLSRRELIFGTPSLAAMAGAQERKPPNIVLVVLDDLGSGDLGCYGQKHIRTPNIDRLAGEGTRSTDCYAGGAVCAPSRSVLMTGLHTGHTPVRANAGTVPLAASDTTLARMLKSAGYATGGFGKWGLGDDGSTGVPTRHGFDEFFGYLHQMHAHSYYPEFLWDNGQKMPLQGNQDGRRGQHTAALIAERSFDFIRKNKDRPFFLYACYTLPHGRFEVPGLAPYESEPWTQGQKTYAAMISLADQHVGRIGALLQEFALERDTVVFVTSDNGAHSGGDKGFEFFRSNGALRGEKGQLYEGGIRVPMIARWPGRVKAGSTTSFPWYFCDFLPTLAELAGVKPGTPTDGVSVLPALTGLPQPAREFLYWEFNTYDRKMKTLRHDRLTQAVRVGEWKAIRQKPGARLELFNLKRDPSETMDVAGANSRIVRRIEDYMATARTEPRSHDNGSFDWDRS